MNKIISFAIAGFAVGALIAEFDPNLFADVFHQIGASFAGPFSDFRNHLALRWGGGAAAIGALVGFLIEQMGGRK